MSWTIPLLSMISGIIVLMLLGFPVAIAFLIVNVVSAFLIMGGLVGVEQFISNGVNAITSFALVPVPLFLLMGELFFHTGLALRVFDALDKLLGRIPGRLSYLTVGGGTLFAALSGSSMANTAMLGSLMVPDMVRRGYKPHMVIGPIMGTGCLAIIIPPSGLAVLLGSIARIDIGSLLIAGILPGVLLAFFYAMTIYLQVRFDPDAAPKYEVSQTSFGEKVRAILVDVAPMGLVMFCVIGLIILGWATPTESAAFGAVAVIVLALAYRRLTWAAVVKSLRGSLSVTAMLLLIIFASSTFSQILGFSGASAGLVRWATGQDIDATIMLLIMIAIYLVLGCFMEQLSIMMLTLPLYMPLAIHYGFDEIWFGLLLLLSLEVGLLTPPFGLVLFVMAGVAPKGTRFEDVVQAALPYIACAILLIILVIIFPQIATYLPSLIRD
jgi:tripartite ATP-independent transporter DctM subunit